MSGSDSGAITDDSKGLPKKDIRSDQTSELEKTQPLTDLQKFLVAKFGRDILDIGRRDDSKSNRDDGSQVPNSCKLRRTYAFGQCKKRKLDVLHDACYDRVTTPIDTYSAGKSTWVPAGNGVIDSTNSLGKKSESTQEYFRKIFEYNDTVATLSKPAKAAPFFVDKEDQNTIVSKIDKCLTKRKELPELQAIFPKEQSKVRTLSKDMHVVSQLHEHCASVGNRNEYTEYESEKEKSNTTRNQNISQPNEPSYEFSPCQLSSVPNNQVKEPSQINHNNVKNHMQLHNDYGTALSKEIKIENANDLSTVTANVLACYNEVNKALKASVEESVGDGKSFYKLKCRQMYCGEGIRRESGENISADMVNDWIPQQDQHTCISSVTGKESHLRMGINNHSEEFEGTRKTEQIKIMPEYIEDDAIVALGIGKNQTDNQVLECCNVSENALSHKKSKKPVTMNHPIDGDRDDRLVAESAAAGAFRHLNEGTELHASSQLKEDEDSEVPKKRIKHRWRK